VLLHTRKANNKTKNYKPKNTTSALFSPSIKTLTSLKTARRNTALPVVPHITQQALQPTSARPANSYKLSVSPCALAGQTAEHRLSLIFLFLFLSSEKERKAEKERRKNHNIHASQQKFTQCPGNRTSTTVTLSQTLL
jgi:hypothetical protein